MAKVRISFLKVPLDILEEEDFYQEITDLSQKKEYSQICFVSIWDILKARRNQEYMECLQNASLVLPVSPSIIRGCKFLKLDLPVRYNQFKAVINIMNVLDKNFRSIYLLGGRKEVLRNVEKNVHATFPGLQIVGRYVGYYHNNFEPNILEAIHKASPTLLLTSEGLKGGDLWITRRKEHFQPGIFLYYRDCFGIFSKRKKRISDKTFKKGNEMGIEIVRNPFKLFLFFPYLWYLFLLLVYKFKK
ncbi:MAG: WecB/TagA/CpsF family glycosyltransferase [Treponemataceae bacterium]|nr:WecB/TagA/CpsF family glycosyltransferase [Treponemataceae bacterium]